MLFFKVKRIHFVGIGGAGMSGIAEVLHNLGFTVTGSDIAKQSTTRYLESLGIPISYNHLPENVFGADVVVVSSAIHPDNPEVLKARELKIPVIPRAEMLAELMRMKFSIAVSGAHGKTTTTSMIAKVLEDGNLDPTVVVGGKIRGLGTGAKLGQGTFLVAEADESDRSFLSLFPTISVITNIDEEHLEAYSGSLEALKEAFITFANRVPFYGCIIVNLDDPGVQEILPRLNKRVITYGFTRDAQIHVRDGALFSNGSKFIVYKENEELGTLVMNLPGKHNVKNALAAISIALELEIPIDTALKSLEDFKGVERRFEIKGEKDGILFLDDYAHHPTEIEAVLDTARAMWKGRIVVLFQPHRYTRTKRLHRRFGKSFEKADVVVITKLYPAGELPIEGVNSELIYKSVKEKGAKKVYLIENRDEVVSFLSSFLKSGDLFITMGAGDIWKLNEILLKTEKKT